MTGYCTCLLPERDFLSSIPLLMFYGNVKILVKNVRKFQKYDLKYKKAILDLDVLFTCQEKNIILKFLRFKVGNRQLQFSNTYNICLKRSFNQEISKKPKLVRTTKQNLILWGHSYLTLHSAYFARNVFFCTSPSKSIKMPHNNAAPKSIILLCTIKNKHK